MKKLNIIISLLTIVVILFSLGYLFLALQIRPNQDSISFYPDPYLVELDWINEKKYCRHTLIDIRVLLVRN